MIFLLIAAVILRFLWFLLNRIFNKPSIKGKSENIFTDYSKIVKKDASGKDESLHMPEISLISDYEKQRIKEQKEHYEQLALLEQKIRELQEIDRKTELRNQQTALRLREQQEAEKQAQQEAKLASLKQDWVSFQDVVQKNGIVKMYHFTDKSNIDSIKRNGGLFSWHYCQQNGIHITKPGGSSDSWVLDKRKGLENYVRASFAREHPMMFIAKKEGRVSDPVILEIALDVMYLKSTKFCNQNAVRNGVLVSDSLECFTSINFSVLGKRYFDLSPEDKSYYQAEVLVLEKIPLEYITNINKF